MSADWFMGLLGGLGFHTQSGDAIRWALRVRRAADAAPVGLLVTDSSDRIVYANVAAARMLAPPTIGPRHAPTAITAIDRAALAAHVASWRGGSPRPMECSLLVGDAERTVLLAPAPISRDAEAYEGVALALIDLGGVRATPNDLLEARAAVLRRDEFIAMAAHELRSPLSVLRADVSQLVEDTLETQIDPSRRDVLLAGLDGIGRRIETMSRLVGNLLDTSRIRVNRISLLPERFNLCDLAREVVGDFDREAARAGSEIVVDAEGDVSGLWDRTHLTQVIGNLLSNAIRYGAGAPVEVRVRWDRSEALLAVRDHGPGIDPQDHGRIFEQFEQLRPPGRGHRGLGLGLWVVRRLVELHGGTVRVRSRVGSGAEFSVRLPPVPRG